MRESKSTQFRPFSSSEPSRTKCSDINTTRGSTNEYVTSVEDHLMTNMDEKTIVSSWSMGSPAGLRQFSCSGSLRRCDKLRLNLISEVCLLPGYHEASGIHQHYHPVRWHFQVLVRVIHPSHGKEERTDRVRWKTSLIHLESFLDNLSLPAFICLCYLTSLISHPHQFLSLLFTFWIF